MKFIMQYQVVIYQLDQEATVFYEWFKTECEDLQRYYDFKKYKIQEDEILEITCTHPELDVYAPEDLFKRHLEEMRKSK